MSPKDEWQLMHADTPIAILKVYDSDQPWYLSNFIPNENFANHKAFFTQFQERYKSGKIKNFDEFFAELKENKYSIKLDNKIMVEFMLLFEDSNNKARIRSREIINT
ncbi:MAG TPA: hypothetical protein ENJ44_06070 [Oceanospirillales bacterium]|nr:hypothetical protein [Oceanospirillales bacterium]